ncbi:glycerophosphodiester phosphodiesterase [Paenibacillus chartarius]|uniref:Glycerophosphodiester phosphodiesterase n=1 Tax=Paenibacillus chartarius TaxID=747481 RepID=A0ABV6DGL4_9BACL
MGSWIHSAGTRPLIIAHRGAAAEAPENTMAAFRKAIEQGCDAIELDVHLTADGQVVVFHDETLERTTNRSGPVGSLTWDELRQADAGAWFGRDFAGERVPLLSEVLELMPAAVGLNLELKLSYGGRMVAPVARLLREYGRAETTVISSYDHKLLYRMKQEAPEVLISLVYDGRLLNPLRLADDFGHDVFSFSLHHRMVEEDDVAPLRAAGKPVIVWTANREEDIRRLAACGVSGIITDVPGAARAWL